MKNQKKEPHSVSDEQGHPSNTKEESSLTSRQKEILKETMKRHDKALKRLSEM
jgi:hypothetical protein